MNRQRKVVITITYNEMGIIIDTKAEEVAQTEKRTEERTETHACDCISRQAAIDALREAENHAFNAFYKGLVKAHKIIVDLPPAPERKTGKWTINDCHAAVYKYHCSACGANHRARYDFCPSCGADMREEQDG